MVRFKFRQNFLECEFNYNQEKFDYKDTCAIRKNELYKIHQRWNEQSTYLRMSLIII
ncbi:unnamed protein product [Paramecium octaurelia]|uniref:Uncharacterized protein n=1 Tax=Paramecium octaurelia TaxID=43137 RepID=A0A8S1W1B2_PAROT|nr:unnamed protein product [Paramecium octaurelia]